MSVLAPEGRGEGPRAAPVATRHGAELLSELDRWLWPQERFEALRRDCWNTAGRSLCDLSYANPYDGPPPEVYNVLEQALRSSSRRLGLQYTPYGGGTIPRRLVAEDLAKSHGAGHEHRDVILTPGAMAALQIVLRAVGDEGGEIVTPAPCWLDVPLYAVDVGQAPVLVPLRPRTHRLDLDRIAAALGPKTRAFVLSQPANPTGVLYGDEELAGLARVLHEASARIGRPIPIVSDECHRDVIFGARPFVSPIRHYPLTWIVYSFGKRSFIQGQRLGYAAVPPSAPDRALLSKQLERLCRVMGFCTPTALMQLAVPGLLAAPPNLQALRARRERLLHGLVELGYECGEPDATFFAYPRSPVRDDFEFVATLARAGVLTLPAGMFHHTGHFRISLTASDEMIDRALGVLGRARTGRMT